MTRRLRFLTCFTILSLQESTQPPELP